MTQPISLTDRIGARPFALQSASRLKAALAGAAALALIGTSAAAQSGAAAQSSDAAQANDAARQCDWSGRWTTEIGEVTIRHSGKQLIGQTTGTDLIGMNGTLGTSDQRCEASLFFTGSKPNTYYQVDLAVLQGDSFSGEAVDRLTPGGVQRRLTATRPSRFRTPQLQTQKQAIRRAVGTQSSNPTVQIDSKDAQRLGQTFEPKLSPKVNTELNTDILVKRQTGTVDGGPVIYKTPVGGTPKWAPKAAPAASGSTTSGSTVTSSPAPQVSGLAKHLPYLTEKRADFEPRYIELELTDFRNETRLHSDVYGLLGFYAGCNSDEGSTTFKALGGQKNRVMNSERGASNIGGKTAILTKPKRDRTRRFALDQSCFFKPGGEIYLQTQTNFKRHVPVNFDPVFGYAGFAVNLSDLMSQDEGLIRQSIDLIVVESGCADGHINTVTRNPSADTADSMAFDWRFSATAPLSLIPGCDLLTQSTVRIRLVE